MRSHQIVILMSLPAVLTAGCTRTSTESVAAGTSKGPASAGTSSGPAPAGSSEVEAGPVGINQAGSVGINDDICIVWMKKLFGDPGESAVRYFDNLRNSPAQYPVPRRIAIRQAYYALQEKEIRKLAATATDPALQAALRTVADESAELGRDTTPDGPPGAVPDMSPVLNVCGGTMIGVPSTR